MKYSKFEFFAAQKCTKVKFKGWEIFSLNQFVYWEASGYTKIKLIWIVLRNWSHYNE